MLKNTLESWDERRDLILLSSGTEAVRFAAEHWIHSAQRAIQQRGRFAVALSGGSTPKAIFEALCQNREVDWKKIFLFWSDERAVAPDHPESNYKMAMDAGFQKLPIPADQIFRMHAEGDLEREAKEYEEKIRHSLGKNLFDLVMLGVGEDGHTASLFPETRALQVENSLVTTGYCKEKKSHRLTLTFSCINQSARAALYALGASKKEIVSKVLQAPIDSPWPASRIGTSEHKALWVLDKEASLKLKK